MNISTIGTGRMAVGLGKLWAEAGHDVFLGSRTLERGRQAAGDLAAAIGADIHGGTHAEAVAAGDVILLAIPFSAAVMTVGRLRLRGKIVIDLTNVVSPDGLPATGAETSAAEQIAAAAPSAKVVKAFNGIYYQALENPVYGGKAADVFFCGDDVAAKEIVEGLIADTGFNPVDVGPLAYARMLEPLAVLWNRLAFDQGFGTHFAFKLIRRQDTPVIKKAVD